jgi:hypothetical protein
MNRAFDAIVIGASISATAAAIHERMKSLPLASWSSTERYPKVTPN